jgi:sulfur carrier protein
MPNNEVITITLNGQTYATHAGTTLQQLITAMELSGKAIAVAVNRRVMPALSWESVVVEANDKVDVVRAIGGG